MYTVTCVIRYSKRSYFVFFVPHFRFKKKCVLVCKRRTICSFDDSSSEDWLFESISCFLHGQVLGWYASRLARITCLRV